MIARTSGPETLQRLRDFIFSLDAKRYYVIYFPHIQLDGDLFHQDPSHLIHYEDYLFTWSPRLSHTRTGRFREIKFPLFYRRLYFWHASSFHINGMDAPEAMITRKYWADWRQRNDFIRYPALLDYVRERIREEYGTESHRNAGARYIRERSAGFIPYDSERFGPCPELLEPFRNSFPLRLVYRKGKIAGRSDIMELLDRLDAEKMNRSVDVIIPTRNREEHALAAISMLLKEDYPRYRVLVVDQSDALSEELHRLAGDDPRVIYHRAPPEGLPAARNEGIRISDAEFVIYIDDDVIPEPGFIAGHVRAYEDDRVGAVAGRIMEKNRKDVFGHSGKPGRIHYWTGKLERNFTGNEYRDVDSVGGGNMSFRRKALDAAGGFDRGYGGAYLFEETDVALAVRRKGYRIRYSPHAALTHLAAPGGGCRVPDFRREIYWYAHNFMLLFLKHFPRYVFPVWFSLRMAKFLRDAAVYRSISPLVWGFRGFRDGYARYRKEIRERVK
jgi:GT2 family glycosyltransferase